MGTAAASIKSRFEPILAKPLSEIVANPIHVELLRRDVSVTAKASQFNGCDQITFDLTFSPGIFDLYGNPDAQVQVSVLVIPSRSGLIPPPARYTLRASG